MKYRNLQIYLFSLSVFLLSMMPNLNEPFDNTKNIIYSVTSFISILVYLYVHRKLYKTWVRFETLFIIGFVIVHFQIPFLYSIDIEPSNVNFVFLNFYVVNFATWLSAMVVHVWMIGSTFSTIYTLKKNRNKTPKFYKISYNINRVDLILLISFLGFFATAGTALLAGAHDGMGSWGEGASYFMVLLRVSLYFRTFLFFKDLQKLTFSRIIDGNLIYLTITSIYLIVFLLIGDRGPFMQFAIVMAFCYGLFVKNIKFRTLAISIFIGAVTLSIIGLGRAVEDGNMFQSGYQNYLEKDTNPTEELASSVRIMYRALEYFPDKIDFLNGLQFLLGIAGMFPFMSGLLITMLGIPNELTASSKLFTYIGQGAYPTYGEGTEIISDIYINFGFVGVFLIMFLYGYFVNKITFNALILRSDIYIVVLIVLVSTALNVNRGQFLAPLKDVGYIILIYYFVRKKISILT